MLLIETLRGRERALGGEAVAVVGLALERREVVEHRRFLALLLLLELRDRPRLAAARRDDRRGLLLGADARAFGVSGAAGRRLVVAEISALAGGCLALERPRGEGRVDQPVGLGLEGLDLLLAARDDRERRRLHAPERDGTVEGAAQPDRGRAGCVHTDDPVGLRARACGLLEALELRGGAQRLERAFHRCVRHRVQPQPFDGLFAFGLLEQVGEDQLALAARVAGVDDLFDVLAAELFGHDRHLLARALIAHDEFEALGHDRQIAHPPALEFGVVGFRFGQLDEVPDRPGHHVIGSLEEALPLLEGARAARAPGPAPRRASRRLGASWTWRQRSGWCLRGFAGANRARDRNAVTRRPEHADCFPRRPACRASQSGSQARG